MKLQRVRAAFAVVTAIVAVASLVTDPAEARVRNRSADPWQGWQTHSPNPWNPAAFWQWRAGLLP